MADALDSVPTPEDNVEELGQRLRGLLMQLLGITANYVAADREQPDPRIKQAGSMCEEDMPGDYRQGLGHLRRMGWAVNELGTAAGEGGVGGPRPARPLGGSGTSAG
ncbi:DUF6415 family natural product biosynthesis protein [Streptomyces sp. NPDC007971]|uniref:DUF6415 family natural product biosynthesis protein n=1 Tax=Streptomyces sp. NPDC007971 TaxID=3364799 RepID=UPI0036E7C908